MFVKIHVVLAVVLSGLLAEQAAARPFNAYHSCAYTARFGLKVRPGIFEPPWRGKCQTDECLAERDVQCVVDAVANRDVPNTIAYASRQDADAAQRGFEARIAAFGRVHPGRVPLYCAALVRRTRRAARRLANLDNQGIIETTTELAARLDDLGEPCLDQVLAVLPRMPLAAKVIEASRGYCYASRPVCDRIRLPMATP